ncbi:MAG: PP2C family protein-serine/threonine phosphatase, partial [Trebonia sp.]
ALTLQRALLPDALPVVPGFTFEARYLASSGQASVGGDFHDAFDLPSGRIVALIGDVQGHSLRAATVMAELRFAMRAYLLEMHEPANALRLLNELMMRNYPDDTATVVLAVFDASSGQVEVVNAGHLPPLLVTGSAAEYVEGGGLLIGVPGPPPAPVRIELPEQSCLVFVTDGLIERRGESLDDGLEKMRGVVRDAATLDPAAIADLLLERFPAPVAEDDVAILVIGRGAC